MIRPAVRTGLAISAALLATAIATRAAGQAPVPFPGLLDEHPAIDYARRPTTDPVARLNAALRDGSTTLTHEPGLGYLRAVLAALEVPAESQVLVFSKSGIQRAFTGPDNPRALYFNPRVAVGYIAGAPALEFAAHDPQQGTVFYTLDQGATATPAFVRGSTCLTCHVSASTLDVPGPIDRSNRVGPDGGLLQRAGPSITVDHRTPHTERWGGWFVTSSIATPPYQVLGHLGNLTVTDYRGGDDATIVSNHALIRWLERGPSRRDYLSEVSDLSSLLVFDHQMHAVNLLTRLNWDWRVAVAEQRADVDDAAIGARLDEVADYFVFVDEAAPVVEVTPRPGWAERVRAFAPSDPRGRSLADLDLTTRLMRYPVSYMVYTEAFDALPAPVKDAVYRRIFARLAGTDRSPRLAHLRTPEARAAAEILRATKTDLPADLRRSPAPGDAR
ncbi:MAG: hypothetical protein AB7U83_14035 [Vicinamibacterales bacterium]